MRSRRLLPLAIVLLCAALPLAFADQVVYFVNGKAIMVKSVEKGDKFTVLEMEGGGKVGVPTEQISKIEEYVVAAPQPPAPAPVQVAPVAAPAPAQAPVVPVASAVQPPAAAMAPGPAIGGKPMGGPNANLANATPLDIGGNNVNPNPNGQFQRPYAGQAGMLPRGGVPGGPALATAGRANLGGPGGGRFAGRGLYTGGRGGRQGLAGGRPFSQQQPGAAPGTQQPQTTPPQPGAPSAQPPSPPPPAPAPEIEPEAPPESAADSNEEPSDPPAPAEDDSSGNSPGRAS